MLAKIRKKVSILLLAGLLLALTASWLAGCAERDDVVASVLAEVNGEEITQESLDDYLKLVSFFVPGMEETLADEERRSQVEEDVLWILVENTILLQEAERLGITVDQEELDEAYEKGRQEMVQLYYGTDKEYNDNMKKLDLKKEDLMDVYREGQLLTALFEQLQEQVTEEYVLDLMEENPEHFVQPARAKVCHILFEEKDDALSMLEELDDSKDFVQLAQEKEKGRFEDLGYITRDGFFDPLFLEAAFALEAGEVSSEPVETSFGFHLIYLEKKVPEKKLSFDGDREEVLQIARTVYIDDYIRKLLEEAEIETFK